MLNKYWRFGMWEFGMGWSWYWSIDNCGMGCKIYCFGPFFVTRMAAECVSDGVDT